MTFTIDASTVSLCSISGPTVTFQHTGTCVIDANQLGDANYFAAPQAQQTVAIGRGSEAISFVGPGSGAVGGSATLSASGGASGNPVVFSVDSSTAPGICTVSGANGSTVHYQALGTCVIDANQVGNADYAAAPRVQQTIPIRNNQTITFAALANKTLAQSPVTLNATASSGLPVSFATTTPSVCTLNGSTLTLVAAGTCSVTASQPGNATYNAAPVVTRSFSVSAVNQTITFAALANKTLAQSPVTLNATASSGLPVSFATTTPSVCTLNGSTLTLVAAGTCSVTASQPGNATYNAAPVVTRSFSVSAVNQTITFAALANKTLAQSPVTLNATASSGLPVSFATTTPSVCTLNGSTLTLVAAGTCSVTASQPGNATYNAAPVVTRSFSVSAVNQTITFAALANKTLAQSPVTLNATASSGLPVSFATTTPSVCTLNGSTLTLVAAGTCSVTASQPGNATYNAAPNVTRSFKVS